MSALCGIERSACLFRIPNALLVYFGALSIKLAKKFILRSCRSRHVCQNSPRPPGSYKTSGAVMDDFTDTVFSGRVVITNIPFLDDEQRVRDVLTKAFPRRTVPDSFELVWIDTETEEGIFLMQSFWTWADCGAFLR